MCDDVVVCVNDSFEKFVVVVVFELDAYRTIVVKRDIVFVFVFVFIVGVFVVLCRLFGVIECVLSVFLLFVLFVIVVVNIVFIV